MDYMEFLAASSHEMHANFTELSEEFETLIKAENFIEAIDKSTIFLKRVNQRLLRNSGDHRELMFFKTRAMMFLSVLYSRAGYLTEREYLEEAKICNSVLIYIFTARGESGGSEWIMAGSRLADILCHEDNPTLDEELMPQYRSTTDFINDLIQHSKKLFSDSDPKIIAQNYRNLGHIYEKRLEHENAFSAFSNSFKYYENVPDAEQQLSMCNLLLGRSAENLGDLAKSENFYRNSLATFEEAVKQSDSRQLQDFQSVNSTHGKFNAYMSLGHLYLGQGRYEDAREKIDAAFRLFNEINPIENNNAILDIWENPKKANAFVSCLLYLGKCYYHESSFNKALKQERLNSASACFEKSLQCSELALGHHIFTADSYYCLGIVLLELGDKKKAEQHFEKSIELYQDFAEEPGSGLHLAYYMLGQLKYDDLSYQQARKFYEKALTFTQQLPPNNLVSSNIYTSLAILDFQENRIDSCKNHLLSAIKIEDSLLEQNLAYGSDINRLRFARTVNTTKNLLVLYHLKFACNDNKIASTVFENIVSRKGCALAASSNWSAKMKELLPPNQTNLLRKLENTRAQLSVLSHQDIGSLKTEDVISKYHELAAEANTYEQEIGLSVDFKKYGFGGLTKVKVRALQEKIPSNGALIEYTLYDHSLITTSPHQIDEPDNYYAAYVLLSDGSLKWYDLGRESDIDSNIRELLQKIDSKELKKTKNSPRDESERVTKGFREDARDLSAKILIPILEDLPSHVEHLLISPDKGLNLFPFSVLVARDSERFLIQEKYLISYLNSGKDLLSISRTTQPQEIPILIGNIEYGKSDNFNFSRLPGVSQELKKVQDIFNHYNIELQLFEKDDASKTTIKQLNGPAFLHIATHGKYVSEASQQKFDQLILSKQLGGTKFAQFANPLLRSFLALKQANTFSESNQEGIITALEISGCNFHGTQLAVLSACKTGLGKITNQGEVIAGLRRSFFLAGVQSLLVTLWDAPDRDVTPKFIEKFYEQLLKGEELCQAFKSAQLHLIEAEEPIYKWAPFILVGSYQSIDVKSWSGLKAPTVKNLREQQDQIDISSETQTATSKPSQQVVENDTSSNLEEKNFNEKSNEYLIVSKEGSGQYSSISEAIQHASNGATILIQPGIYREQCIVEKPISLVGDSTKGKVVLESAHKEVPLKVQVLGKVSISNLTFKYTTKLQPQDMDNLSEVHGIQISAGEVTVDNCKFYDLPICIYSTKPYSKLVLKNSNLHGFGNGFIGLNRSSGEIKNCDISGHVESNIVLMGFSSFKVENCRISNSAQNGITLISSGQVQVDKSEIFNNKDCGIRALNMGMGFISHSKIYKNSTCGVEARNEGMVSISHSKIYKNRIFGAYYDENGKGLIDNCKLFSNAKANLSISPDSNVPTINVKFPKNPFLVLVKSIFVILGLIPFLIGKLLKVNIPKRLVLLALIAFLGYKMITSNAIPRSEGEGTSLDDICLTLKTDFSAQTLVKGMSGSNVRALQKLLIEEYEYSIPFDARFEQTTQEAVQDFQRQNGLYADGIVGPGSWEALIANSGCQ